MQTSIFPHRMWWNRIDTPKKEALKKKYKVLTVSDRAINRIFKRESNNQ